MATDIARSFDSATYDVKLHVLVFSSGGIQGQETIKPTSDEDLLVIFLCHGRNGDGIPFNAFDLTLDPSTVASGIIRSMTRWDGFRSHTVIPSQCYAGLSFCSRVADCTPSTWKIWNGAVGPAIVKSIGRDSDGKNVYLQTEADAAIKSFLAGCSKSDPKAWLTGVSAEIAGPLNFDITVTMSAPFSAQLTCVPREWRQSLAKRISDGLNLLNIRRHKVSLPSADFPNYIFDVTVED